MSNTTSIRVTGISDETLEETLLAHRIPHCQWDEFKTLVLFGIRPSTQLVRRLNHVGKYMAALNSILATLSAQCKFKFPPKRNCKPSSHRAA